jgi:hypothetical protein
LRSKIEIIGRNKSILHFPVNPFDRQSAAVSVQVPVAAEQNAVTLQQLHDFLADIYMIQRRIMEKT